MANEKKTTGQRKPTGQELDRDYDELHQKHDAEEFPTPDEQQHEKEQELEEYSEELKDPD
jgi:hypothetical protein